MVIEKADKILAEKTRYAGQAAGAGGRSARRNSEPGLDAHSIAGGVGVVKLDLDKLRSGAGVGGDKNAGADAQALRDRSQRTASAGAQRAASAGASAGADLGPRPSELSYVMGVLGSGGRKGERKASDARGGGSSSGSGKGDRRARVDELKEKLLLVWDALGIWLAWRECT
jgi:hypothetical protein